MLTNVPLRRKLACLGYRAVLIGFVLVSFSFTAVTAAQEKDEKLSERGQYIFHLSGGCACHTVPEKAPHAGNRAFPVPFGKVYSTNITADKETGLGNWKDKEIADAMIRGIRPSGERILPVMPYYAYAGMAEEDLRSLVAFLRTLNPVNQKTQPAELPPLARSLGTWFWLKLYGRSSTAPTQAPQSGIERGRYLVQHVSLCGDCHTPRNRLGGLNRSLYLAGNADGPFGELVPNITPDEKTGIGSWTREEIAELLLTGNKPDFDTVQGLMGEVIDAGYKHMAREDALAIADYLKSIPPISNKVR